MSRDHVNHKDILRFAEERVNLKRDDAKDLRAQTNRLREKLEGYIAEHPHFELKRMLLSGSLAKGTALKSTSDIDVGCYISSDAAPAAVSELVDWLVKKLEKAFPNFKPEQIKPKTYSVGVNFLTTGNEVDIVPILYTGDPEWRGNLISQDTGKPLMTSVPMHLDFIRKRKKANDQHYAQIVRLLKFWANIRKNEDEGFRFKSFMIELIVAHLADQGTILSDYPEALQSVFTYLASDDFRTTIAFSDYYNPKMCEITKHPIRVWDPVNCENNVASLYDSANKTKIVQAALDAGDAIDSALCALTKGDTVRYWQKVFGPTFSV